MKAFLLAVFLSILTHGNAFAVDFQIVEYSGKRYTVCRVKVREEHIQLYHRDEGGQPFKRFERLATYIESHGRKLVFAMNAGMYHPDFSAVGLFVSEGREIVPLNTKNGEGNFFLKPNGVFAIFEDGARVVEASEYLTLPGHATLATQSGPLLVRSGRIHPAFHDDSKSRLFRNGVGVPSADAAIFVISEEPVNFYEFATLFRDKLHCPDALFLDGTISSLYSTELKRSDFRMDLGPIIGVTR